MMNMIRKNSQRFVRIRPLHTIISQETIKPSSSTPQHLKIHNLSLIDHFSPNILMPKVLFYKNYNKNDTNIIKQSLSKSLTQYYPFAGRFPTDSNYIHCNDEGVEFTEASNDSPVDDFILNRNQDESLDQLIPNGLEGTFGKTRTNNLLKVQLNHFAGGGVAIAVSVSHKIADGFTAASFINHWANVTCGQSLVTPKFFSPNACNDIVKIPQVTLNKRTEENDYIARSFIFSNSKLQELKNKVIATEKTPLNPSRVEVLTSLIFKCILRATTTNSGHFKPANLLHTLNMRNKIMKSSHEIAAGNIMTLVIADTAKYYGEIVLDKVIMELKKAKSEVEEVRDVQDVGKHFLNTMLMLGNDKGLSYVVSSSLCRLPFYNADFGWGKPTKVKTRYPDVDDNGFILLDTPSGDGIEALVHLKREKKCPFLKWTKSFLHL